MPTERPRNSGNPHIQEWGLIKRGEPEDLSPTPLISKRILKRGEPEDPSPVPLIPKDRPESIGTHTPTPSDGIKRRTKGQGESLESKGKSKGMKADLLPPPHKTSLDDLPHGSRRDLTMTAHTQMHACGGCTNANIPIGAGLQMSRSERMRKGQSNNCKVIDNGIYRDPIGRTRPRTRAWCRMHPNGEA